MAGEAEASEKSAMPRIAELLGRDQIEELLGTALSKGAELSEVYAEYCVSSEVTLDEGKPKTLSYGVLSGVGIRAIAGESTGYAFADDFDMGKIGRASCRERV